jgi:hypothetical protein
MPDSSPCSECQRHLKVTALGPPHANLSLLRSKAFRGVMAGRHDEYIYRCGTCQSMLCRLDHGDGRVIFWYIISDLPDWARSTSAAE